MPSPEDLSADQAHHRLLPYPPSRRPSFRLRRRRKVPTVRLGQRRPRLLLRLFARIRLRWLAAQYARAVKRLRTCYAGLLRDLINGSAEAEAFREQVLMNSCYAMPMMPVAVGFR